MSVPTTNSPCLSYANIVNAMLVPSDFELPWSVLHLQPEERHQLLRDPLTLLDCFNIMYTPQRELLYHWSTHRGVHHHLQQYSAGVYHLSDAAWDFMVEHGTPDNTTASALKADGVLTSKDQSAITDIYVHWLELQQHACDPSPPRRTRIQKVYPPVRPV